MAAGEHLSSSDRASLDETIRRAEQLSRAEISVFVGRAEVPADADAAEVRQFATSLHNTLVAPARSILIMVDPERRALEVVTGGFVRRTLDDVQVRLAIETMTACFAEGDLVGGLRRGILHLAEHARPPATLHAG